MAGRNQYKAQQFIDVIPGTGGIISTIAKRVGCSWHTAKKYIDEYATVKQAYNDECEVPIDWAQSVVIRNIALALKKQEQTEEPVDSADAKWYLIHKGKDRGFTQRQEISGPEGGAVVINYTGNVNPEDV
jgi:hypothetical protein